MDDRSIDDAPPRPFGGIPLDRHIGALAAVPRPRSDAGSGAWSSAPPTPFVVPSPRLPSDDDLIERTLSFSGSYVSDDGHVAIRRVATSRDYSGHRFVGYCRTCARGRLMTPTGELLPDVAEAVRFTATHDHDEVD
jgi:hypothetical protein